MPDSQPNSNSPAPTGDALQATLDRLRALVDKARFESESDRNSLKATIDDLQHQVTEPQVAESLHESLQFVEQSTMARLHDEDTSSETSELRFSWHDAKRSFDEGLLQLEANHPKLAAALARLEHLLSASGV